MNMNMKIHVYIYIHVTMNGTMIQDNIYEIFYFKEVIHIHES